MCFLCLLCIGLFQVISTSMQEYTMYAQTRLEEDVALENLIYLIHFNVDVCFHSPDPVSYYNPLHIAVLRNRPNMVRLLVGHGADIEKRDRVRLKQNKEICMHSLVHTSSFLLSYQFV